MYIESVLGKPLINMKNIYVRFSANYLPLSWAIRARTWSKYSHVDFVLPEGKFLGAIPTGGVCVHEHKYPIEDYFKLEVTEEQFDLIMGNAWGQLGKPYDFMGIFGFALNRDWQEDDNWFCSEFLAGSIQPVIKLFNEEAYKIAPRDIAIHHLFIKVTKDEVIRAFYS